MKYQDLAGQDISVGDYVVYSAAAGRSAALKMGRVSGLGSRKDGWRDDAPLIPTLKVVSIDAWKDGFGWRDFGALQNKGKPITLGMLDRVLVVTQVPALAAKFEQLKAKNERRLEGTK